MSKERATLRVKPTSWHYRLYSFWKRTDVREINRRAIPGKPPGYKENLCHYWRVVLLWAPIRAFLVAHPKKHAWLRPWVVLLAVAAVVGIVAALVFATETALLAAALFFVSVVGSCLFLFLLDRYDTQITNFLTAVAHGVAGWRLWDVIGDAGLWFGTENLYRGVIYPWTITVTAIIFALGVLFPLAAFGAFAGVGAFALSRELKKRLDKFPVEKAEDKGPGFGKVTWEYVVAKKHGVCPFIEVEGRDAA